MLLISSMSIILSQILQRQKNEPPKKMCNGNSNLKNVYRGSIVEDYSESIRTTILFIYTLVDGIELGYKCVNRQLIFLLNYCHFVSYIQLYLIATIPFKRLRRSSRMI